MNPDRPDCLDHLLTMARRMRFLFGCFGTKDNDGDDTNPLIPEAGPSVNEAPFPLENKPASLHVREEHRVVFKDVENGSKSADNNADGDNNDMVLKDEVSFPLENKSASLHVWEEHRVVFKGMENGSQSADNNVGGDNDDMVLNNEVPFRLENMPTLSHVREEHRVLFKDVENGSQSVDNNIERDNDDMVLKDEVPYPLENKPSSLHVHGEHRVVCKDVENASQSADNNVDGDNDDMVGLKDEIPFLLENKPASLHVQEGNNVDGEIDDMVVLQDEVPFLLENKPASLHVQEENNVDGDDDYMVVLKDEVPFLLENEPASLHVHEEHRVVFKDVENASQPRDNTINLDNGDMVVVKVEVPFLLENEPAPLHVHEDYRVVFKDVEIVSQSEDNTVDGDNYDMVVVMVERVVFNDVENSSESKDNNIDGDNADMVVLKVEEILLELCKAIFLWRPFELGAFRCPGYFNYQAELLELSCTLLETTPEIQKASETMEATPDDGDNTASKFHSLFTGTSGMQLNLEEQPDQVPTSPAQFHEEPGMPLMSENSDFPELNSSSFGVFESPTTEVQRQNQRNHIDLPGGSAFASPGSPASPLEVPAHSNSSNASPTVTHESPASPLDVPAHSNSSDASSTVTPESPTSLEVLAHSNSSDDSATVTPALPIAITQGKKIVRFECDAAVNRNNDFLPSSSSPAKSETQTCNRSDSSGTDDGRGPLPGPLEVPAHSNSSNASPTVTHESPASPLDVPAHSNSSDASSAVTPESPASLEVLAHSNSSNDSATVTPALPIATMQGKKIVRFECDAAVNPNDDFLPSSSSPAKSETQTCNRSDSSGTDDGRGPLPGPQHSPYPTPLKLTDEMQTPGTVYPAKLIATAIQNDTGIRYQSVYPFPTSMGNLGLLEQCPEEDIEQIFDAKLELLLKASEKSGPTVPDERAERCGWHSISRDGLDCMRDDSDSMSRDDSDSLSSEDGANIH